MEEKLITLLAQTGFRFTNAENAERNSAINAAIVENAQSADHLIIPITIKYIQNEIAIFG
ncbi:MAG: hypothetical protein ACOYN6_02455 [Ignavibacteria bacterium]